MKRSLPIALLVYLLLIVSSPAADLVRHEIHFPDLEGYKTLKCDLHMHTVFSDGHVWPTTRVGEVWQQGLDCISITDHFEYRPHSKDVSKDLNRTYELCADLAKQLDMLLIRGGEITKRTPPGHFNVIFVKDLGPLNDPDIMKQAKLAVEQGGFMFWNHPLLWDGRWTDTHEKLYKAGLLRGIEICNSHNQKITRGAFRIALEKDLTLLGNSDVHPPFQFQRTTSDNHRTMTLVFAKERTLAAVQEALNEKRTIVWQDDTIYGREKWMAPFFERSIRVSKPTLRVKNKMWIMIENLTSADIQLERVGKIGPPKLTLPARSTTNTWIRVTPKGPAPTELQYKAVNFLIGPDKPLPVTLKIPQ